MKRLFYLFAIFTLSVPAVAQNYISAVEYWFDTSYATRVNQSVVLQQQLFFNANVNTNGIPKGLHTFNIRFYQTPGYWSQTLSSYFIKTGEDTSASSAIKAYRYWVYGIDSTITINLASPVSPVDIVATLDLSWIHSGNNYLSMQFCDEQENWSVATIDTFYKSPITVAAFYTNDTLLCTGDTVHFNNNSNDANIYTWSFGDGDSSNVDNPIHQYALPGDYTVTLTSTDTTTGNDSTYTVINYIHVMPSAIPSFTFVESGNQVTFTNTSQNALTSYWQFGDSTHSTNTNPVHWYTIGGNYTVTLTVTDSCRTVSDTQVVSLTVSVDEIFPDNLITIMNDNNNVHVLFHDDMKRCSFSLIDPSGRIILTEAEENILSGYRKVLSIVNLSSGIYFLKLHDEKKSMVKILVKL